MDKYLHALFIWAILGMFGRWLYVESELKLERYWHKHYKKIADQDREFALEMLDKINELEDD